LKKILFMAEVVSWSQVVQLGILARGLDPHRYEIHFASAQLDESCSRHEFHAQADRFDLFKEVRSHDPL
jgi:hypothetical protein